MTSGVLSLLLVLPLMFVSLSSITMNALSAPNNLANYSFQSHIIGWKTLPISQRTDFLERFICHKSKSQKDAW